MFSSSFENLKQRKKNGLFRLKNLSNFLWAHYFPPCTFHMVLAHIIGTQCSVRRNALTRKCSITLNYRKKTSHLLYRNTLLRKSYAHPDIISLGKTVELKFERFVDFFSYNIAHLNNVKFSKEVFHLERCKIPLAFRRQNNYYYTFYIFYMKLLKNRSTESSNVLGLLWLSVCKIV